MSGIYFVDGCKWKRIARSDAIGGGGGSTGWTGTKTGSTGSPTCSTAMAGPKVITGISVPPAMMEDFTQICAPLNDINPGFPFKIDERKPSDKPSKAWGTDSGPLGVAGVPVPHFNTGDTKGYDFSYMEIWHTERDTYDNSKKEYPDHVSIVTAVVVYGAANLDHLLNRERYWKE